MFVDLMMYVRIVVTEKSKMGIVSDPAVDARLNNFYRTTLPSVDEASSANISAAFDGDKSFGAGGVGGWVGERIAKITNTTKSKPKPSGLNRAFSIFAGGTANPTALEGVSKKGPAKNIKHKKATTAWENPLNDGKQVMCCGH